MSSPKAPKVDTSAQDAMMEQQRLQSAALDEEENRRRKRLFSAASGPRAYAGSPLFRRAPSNAAGSAPSIGTSQAGTRVPRAAAPRGGNRYAIP